MGCQQETNLDESESTHLSDVEVTAEEKPDKVYEVTCVGGESCSEPCALEGFLSSDGSNSYVQCNCTDCEMLVVVTSKEGVQTQSKLKEAQLQMAYIDDFMSYHQTISESEYVLDKISISIENGNESHMFLYTDSDGATGSVLYAKAAGDDKAYRVDCHGDCDCRERYIFDPVSVECTCDDCVMDITPIPSQSSGM